MSMDLVSFVILAVIGIVVSLIMYYVAKVKLAEGGWPSQLLLQKSFAFVWSKDVTLFYSSFGLVELSSPAFPSAPSSNDRNRPE